MSVAIITGSCGLVGSESAAYFAGQGMEVIGIDNDMRAQFFGPQSSTKWMRDRLKAIKGYTHITMDIRDARGLDAIFHRYAKDIALVIHAAAQPSHDLASALPTTDFSINAGATSVILEATRRFSPEATFIFLSTNKVYGSCPVTALHEYKSRWDLDSHHIGYQGINEWMSIDKTMHSLFGASKVAADILVQEYGHYFGMRTVCFRCGCLTGPNHSGAELHGFLSYLMKCAVNGDTYKIYGYKGKQVRDNLDSSDLIAAFSEFVKAPRSGAVYNMGGGRLNSCSILEAVEFCQMISGNEVKTEYREEPRKGDHVWWITNTNAFLRDYPAWSVRRSLNEILQLIHDSEVSDTVHL